MSIALTNAARAAIKKALRGKVAGLDSMAKADLLAAAAANGIDVESIIAATPDTQPEPGRFPTREEEIERMRVARAAIIPVPEITADTTEDSVMKLQTDNAKATKIARLMAELMAGNAAPLDESRIIELIREHAPKADTREIVVVREVKSDPQPARNLPDAPRHAVFPEVLAAVSAGLNVMLVGPAGAGKTHLCQQVAEALQLGFAFTGALDSPYKLLGFMDAQGRVVKTSYRNSYENGGVFAWDEIDASAPAAMLAFNAGLANGHQDFPDAIIPRHDDARFIASANTYGRGQDRVYVGRNQLDAASLDRFVMVEMDYDEKLERRLFGDDDWVAYVHKVRAAVRALNLRVIVSMRAIEQGQKLLGTGMARDKVKKLTLWKGLDAATVGKIEAAV